MDQDSEALILHCAEYEKGKSNLLTERCTPDFTSSFSWKINHRKCLLIDSIVLGFILALPIANFYFLESVIVVTPILHFLKMECASRLSVRRV